MQSLAQTLERAVRNASTTREVVLQDGALAALPAVVQRCAPGQRWLLVADANTWGAAGHEAQARLSASVQQGAGGQAQSLSVASPLILPAEPRVKPHVELAERVAAAIRSEGALPVAVGSGVISDVVKYAATLAGQPYVCVATAASMDGYAASGAALLQDGFKRTLACAPPLAVLADPGVLAVSPRRMTAWGYGDLAGKVVAGADWLLADALGVEALNPAPFCLVQDHLRGWLGQPEALARHAPNALADLLGGLLITGFAMQAHGNSRPASGSDHQFSHLWEMEALQIHGEPAAHGACVGVGCVAMLALYEWTLSQPADALARAADAVSDFDDVSAIDAEIAQSLGEGEIAQAARQEMRVKRALGKRRARAHEAAQAWPLLAPRLQQSLMPSAQMQQLLRAVGAAAHPADLGVSLHKLAADYRRARLIRRRYTLLDLLDDLGWLDRALAEIFSAHGFWGRTLPNPPSANNP